MITTWPRLTEAMYLARQSGGYPAQTAVWRLTTAGRLLVHDLATAQIDRMAALMGTHQDRPMGMADASLVAAAEGLAIQSIFTIDSDFCFYRLDDGSVLEVIR